MTANVKGIIIEIDDALFERYMQTTYPAINLKNLYDKEKSFIQLTFENFVTGYFLAVSLDELEVNEEAQLISSHLEYAPKEEEKTNEPVSALVESIEQTMQEAIDDFQPVSLSEFICGDNNF